MNTLPRATIRTVVAAAMIASGMARADEGGASFWLPGQFGSLTAVPGTSGFSVPGIYYHSSGEQGGERNFQLGGNLVAGIDVPARLFGS